MDDQPKTIRDQASIPNTQIESMFMRVATDMQMQTFMNFINTKNIPLATAYASNTVNRIFYKLVDEFERAGGDIENLNKTTKQKVGRPTKE